MATATKSFFEEYYLYFIVSGGWLLVTMATVGVLCVICCHRNKHQHLREEKQDDRYFVCTDEGGIMLSDPPRTDIDDCLSISSHSVIHYTPKRVHGSQMREVDVSSVSGNITPVHRPRGHLPLPITVIDDIVTHYPVSSYSVTQGPLTRNSALTIATNKELKSTSDKDVIKHIPGHIGGVRQSWVVFEERTPL